MIADGTASRAEKAQVIELMAEYGSTFEPEEVMARINQFVARVKTAGLKTVLNQACEAVNQMAEPDVETLTVKCTELAQADSKYHDRERRVIDQIERQVSRNRTVRHAQQSRNSTSQSKAPPTDEFTRIPMVRGPQHLKGQIAPIVGFLASMGLAAEFAWFGAWTAAGVTAVLVVVFFLRRIFDALANHRLGTPSIAVNPLPLKMGMPLVGEFTQPVRRGAKLRSVTVSLVVRESECLYGVEGGQGETSGQVADVYTADCVLPINGVVSPRHSISARFRFELPRLPPVQFRSEGHIRREWLIQTHTDVVNWPSFEATFQLRGSTPQDIKRL